MAIKGVDTKCYILALFVRDDGERFLLGSGHYEFKDTQMHFAANAIQNDIVEVQGNDGFLLAGQVRRPGTQSFDGYVGDGTMSKEETESYRRQFFSFFRKNFFYKVIYVFSDGTAIQRKSGFLVDDPTVEELYQMYPEYHVALNFEDVNYYSYSEDEEGQEQYAKEATIDTSSMWATGGLVWDNLGVVWEATQWGGEQTASGTEMTIQNEMNVPSRVDDIRLDGDTEQQTYSGKNLFSTSVIIGGWTAEGAPINNGVRFKSQDKIIVLPQTTYTFSGIPKDTSKTLNITIQTYDSEDAIISQLPSPNYFAGVPFTFTTPENCTKISFSGRYSDNTNFGTVGQPTDAVQEVQIEAGSSATSYEPYTGGIPAPNPDYPQDIQTVTGEQTVTVTGKNLWGGFANSYSRTNARVDFTTNIDGSITASGTSSQALAFSINNSLAETNNIFVTLKQGTYTISSDYTGNLRIGAMRVSDNAELARIVDNSATFTIGEDTDVFVRLGVPNGTSIDRTLRIQIEAGSTPTAYEPYQSQSYTVELGSIELCKIGDYQDYIYKSGDDWYLHKEFGKLQLDGSSDETWVRQSGGSDNYHNWYEYRAIVLPESISNEKLRAATKVDKFVPVAINYTNTTEGYQAWASPALRFRYDMGNLSSTALWRAWLESNPLTVYYPVTPTDTKITDATLVGQLDALGAMKLFIGENNLIVRSTGTNLPAPLSFKYYTTVAMTGAVWEEGGSGGATVVEVDSITNTYPIWRVKGPAVNPQLSVINTNTTIRYTGTVTSTQTLEIDMFNKTAKLNGVSVIGNVSGDWVSLAPGTNRVIYTAENADAQPSTIEWQEVVG